MRGGRVNLFFGEQRRLTRPEVEALRQGTDQPMEFSLLGHPRIDIDLSRLSEGDRLPHLRGVLGKVG